MMLNRWRHERVRGDGYCWGRVKTAEHGAAHRRSTSLVLLQARALMSSGAPGCSIDRCQVPGGSRVNI